MSEAKRKSHKLYHFYRVYCVTAIAAWNIIGFYLSSKDGGIELMFLMVPLTIPVFFMLINLYVFRFPYSVFGPLERLKPPQEEPLEQLKGSWGWVKWAGSIFPIFTWRLYSSGLFFSIVGIGAGFVELKDITKIREGGHSGAVIISHNSPEVRSPFHIPPGTLVQRLEGLCKRKAKVEEL